MVNAAGLMEFLNSGKNPGSALYSAPWLHSPYHSSEWRVGRDHQIIRWNRSLPDGSTLTDSRYELLLATSKRVLFNSRTSVFVTPIDDERHMQIGRGLFNLMDWIVYQDISYSPATHAFELLDRGSIESFIRQFAHGGTNSVRFVIPRLMKHFDSICENSLLQAQLAQDMLLIPPAVFVRNRTQEIHYDFSDEQISLIRTWLYKNGYYNRKSISPLLDAPRVGYLNRRKIGRLLGIHKLTSGPQLDLFLRQFEYVDDYNKLAMVIRYPDRERIPVDYIPTEKQTTGRMAAVTVHALNTLITNLCLMGPYVKGLPDVSQTRGLTVQTALSQGDVRAAKQTRSIPVDVALHVIESAVQFVYQYGDALIDFLQAWAVKYQLLLGKNVALPRGREAWTFKVDAFLGVQQPAVLGPLRITSLNSRLDKGTPRNSVGGSVWAEEARKCLNLEDALTLLITSVYILTSIMAARRRGEMVNLQKHCLHGTEGCYEVSFDLEKVTVDGSRMTLMRPIPNIVAKGIQQVQRITEICSSLFGDSSNNSLFYFPLDFSRGQPLSYNAIRHRLDMFCDYFEVPLDPEGRRWYVLPHEFRRFFAIVFFWQYKFSNLTALQWMLGHAKPEDTYAYVRSVVGAREMSRAEAQVSCEALLNAESTHSLAELRQLAQRHFHTRDVRLIAKDELELYLETLVCDGALKVRPHALESDSGVRYELVFEVSGIAQ